MNIKTWQERTVDFRASGQRDSTTHSVGEVRCMEAEIADLRARVAELEAEQKRREKADEERYRGQQDDYETASRWNDLNNAG